MTEITPKSWSVSLLAKEIENASAGSESFNTVIVHPAIIEHDFGHCCKQEREISPGSILPTYRATCRKGLWMVEGTDQEYVKKQAMHYFVQYWSDGEYDDILDALENEQ
jgi:hypothetical protein